MFTKHVGAPDMLLIVPLKISDVLHQQSGRLHKFTGSRFNRQRLGPSGEICKDLLVICFTFKVVFVSYGI